MANPQGPVNEEFFNRRPKRESHDFIIDSANRDKVLYPESNNFKIALPICAIKNVRNTGIFFMTLVKTEKTIHGNKIGVNGQVDEGYSTGNQTLAFNEGIRIYNGNQYVKFRINSYNYEVRLPLTLQPILKAMMSNDRLCITTSNPHHYIVGQTVKLIGYPYVSNCATYSTYTDPNTEYQVVEIPSPNVVCLLALDRRHSLGDECCQLGADPDALLPPLGPCAAPLLLFGPLQDQEELAKLTETTFNAQQTAVEDFISVTWNADRGQYTIESSQTPVPFITKSLLADNTEAYIATVPIGDYSSAELARALQTALNQPLVQLGVNDTLEFQEINSSIVHTITLAAGTYTPETLALEIQTLMNAQPGLTNTYCVNYDPDLNCYLIDGNNMAFTLFFSKYPGIAELLGFVPIDQGGAVSYASQSTIYSPRQQTTQQRSGFTRSNNLYSVHYDSKQRVFTILLNGQPANYLVSVTPCADAVGLAIVETANPHGLDLEDIVFIGDEQAAASGIINPGLYVVEQVISSRKVLLNLTVCPDAYTDPSLPIPLANTVSFGSIPWPFNINFAQPHTPILDLLGIVPTSKQSQTVYRSTKDCLHCQPLYLLVEIPEFVNSRLWAQYSLGSPAQKFCARLDADFDDHTYTLTTVPEPIHEDLFIGSVLNLTSITIRIWKPDGKLYDTNRCDWSMWMRFVEEK